MKTKYIVLVTGLLTTLSVWANPALPNPRIPTPLIRNLALLQFKDGGVDFKAVTPVLQSLINEVIKDESQLVVAQPTFDPELSSAQNERLVYGMTGKVKNTQWNSDADLSGSTDYQVVRDPESLGVSVKFSLQAQTDALKLFSYAATSVATKASGFMSADVRHAPLLNRVANARSLTELYSVLMDSKTQAINEINDQILVSEKSIECMYALTCGQVTVDQWGNRQYDYFGVLSEKLVVQELMRMRASFESTQILLDGPDQITLIANAPQGFLAVSSHMSAAETKSLKVSIHQQSITSVGELFASIKSVEELDRLHTNLVHDLNGIVAGDPKSVSKYQSSMRNALLSFKRTINTENIR